MIRRAVAGCWFALSLACVPTSADPPSSGSGGSGTSGTGGNTGQAGSQSTAGTTGSAGTTGGAGTTGIAGITGGAGTTGIAGTTGTAGTVGGGSGGSGGTAGSNAGRGGATGSAGSTGAAGSSAGRGGATAGSTGTAGSSAGRGGATAGTTGTGGSAAGTTGTAGAGGSGTDPLACTRTITVPTMAQLKTNSHLPDPFTFFDGTKVTTKADWACRRKEISLLAQEFIYGRKPDTPYSATTATYSGGTLNITVADGGQSIQFSVPIRGTGSTPGPAIFSIGATAPSGVATIDYAAVGESLAKSNGSQGRINPSGKFYTLYPSYTSTGSLMAWAWGASRVIDALEKTTGHNIDTKRLSALGCSRNGKEAGVIGLFDDRIALVAAQSPGSGLSSGWRVAEAEKNAGANVQTAAQIYGEDTWMGQNFGMLGNANVNKLPVDQHTVIALAWPRPVIIMEGTNDSWNCPRCEYMTMKYAQMVFEALGSKDYISFPQPPHGHCAQAGTFAIDYYNAFVNRFLKNMTSVSTANMFTDTNFTFDMAKWQDGPVPTLN